MPHWISEAIVAIMGFVPAIFLPEGSPHFMLIRGMFGLIFIVLVVYIIAMTPFRNVMARGIAKISNLFARHPRGPA